MIKYVTLVITLFISIVALLIALKAYIEVKKK